MNTAYELGKKAYNDGIGCYPQSDTVFWDYMTLNNLPIVITFEDYIRGYHENEALQNKKAQARRDKFRVIE